jgi:hypothetical protein
MALALSWKPFVKSKIKGYGNDRDDDEQLCHISSLSGTGGVVSVSTWH